MGCCQGLGISFHFRRETGGGVITYIATGFSNNSHKVLPRAEEAYLKAVKISLPPPKGGSFTSCDAECRPPRRERRGLVAGSTADLMVLFSCKSGPRSCNQHSGSVRPQHRLRMSVCAYKSPTICIYERGRRKMSSRRRPGTFGVRLRATPKPPPAHCRSTASREGVLVRKLVLASNFPLTTFHHSACLCRFHLLSAKEDQRPNERRLTDLFTGTSRRALVHTTPRTLATMASSDKRPPTENQISSNPGNQVLITSHNDDGKAVVKATEPVKVSAYLAATIPDRISVLHCAEACTNAIATSGSATMTTSWSCPSCTQRSSHRTSTRRPISSCTSLAWPRAARVSPWAAALSCGTWSSRRVTRYATHLNGSHLALSGEPPPPKKKPP